MTSFSKSCQIELFAAPTMMHRMAMGLPYSEEPEFMPRANKAKHSLIVKTMQISNRCVMKFRLCDFHSEFLQRYHEEKADKSRLIRRFRRNRL